MEDKGRKKISYTIRTLGGAYLMYLTYALINSPDPLSAMEKVVAVLFGLIGLGLVINGTMGLSRIEKEQRKEAQKLLEEQRKAEQKEASEQEEES